MSAMSCSTLAESTTDVDAWVERGPDTWAPITTAGARYGFHGDDADRRLTFRDLHFDAGQFVEHHFLTSF